MIGIWFGRLLMLAFLRVVALAASGTSRPVYVVLSCNDGDTCRVRSSEKQSMRLRLAGIDAPEMSKKEGRIRLPAQPLAAVSRDYLNRLVQGRKVSLRIFGVDLYGRSLAELYLLGENVNLRMLREGMAEVYAGKAPNGVDAAVYRTAQDEARRDKLGIWALPVYESPKEFRSRHAKTNGLQP